MPRLYGKKEKSWARSAQLFSFFPFIGRASFPERNVASAKCSRRAVPIRGATSLRIENRESRIENFSEFRISEAEFRILNRESITLYV